MQKITEKPLTICPSCGGTMSKMISSTSFVLKGSGWYATDYAGKEKKTKEGAEKKEKPEITTKKDTQKELKSEKKTTADSKK